MILLFEQNVRQHVLANVLFAATQYLQGSIYANHSCEPVRGEGTLGNTLDDVLVLVSPITTILPLRFALILLVAHVFHPVNRLAVQPLLKSDMRHGCRG